MSTRSLHYVREWQRAVTAGNVPLAIEWEHLLMESLTPTERRVYELCHARSGGMTANEIAALTKPPIARENVQKTMRRLERYGLLRQVGKRKTANGKTAEDVFEVVMI